VRKGHDIARAKLPAFVAGLGLAAFALSGVMPVAARPVPAPEAASFGDDAPAAWPAQRRSGVSLEQAVQIALRQHQGRVVRAETISRNGRRVHEIRILGDDGRVLTVRIDAQSGDSR
jgi:Peptidase propeptide and YPEB domain